MLRAEVLRVRVNFIWHVVFVVVSHCIRTCATAFLIISGIGLLAGVLWMAAALVVITIDSTRVPTPGAQLRPLPFTSDEPFVSLASQPEAARQIARSATVSATLYRIAALRLASLLPDTFLRDPPDPSRSPLHNLTSPTMPHHRFTHIVNGTVITPPSNPPGGAFAAPTPPGSRVLWTSLWHTPLAQTSKGALRLTRVVPFKRNRVSYFTIAWYSALIWPMLEEGLPGSLSSVSGGRVTPSHGGLPVGVAGTEDWAMSSQDVIQGTISCLAEPPGKGITAIFYERVRNHTKVISLRVYSPSPLSAHLWEGGAETRERNTPTWHRDPLREVGSLENGTLCYGQSGRGVVGDGHGEPGCAWENGGEEGKPRHGKPMAWQRMERCGGGKAEGGGGGGGADHCAQLTLEGSLPVIVAEWFDGERCLAISRLEDTVPVRTLCFRWASEAETGGGMEYTTSRGVGVDTLEEADAEGERPPPYLLPLLLHAAPPAPRGSPTRGSAAPLFAVAVELHDKELDSGKPPTSDSPPHSRGEAPLLTHESSQGSGERGGVRGGAKYTVGVFGAGRGEEAAEEVEGVPLLFTGFAEYDAIPAAGWNAGQRETPAHVMRIPFQARQSKASSPGGEHVALTLDDTLIIYDLAVEGTAADGNLTQFVKTTFPNVAMQGLMLLKLTLPGLRRAVADIFYGREELRNAEFSRRHPKAQFSERGKYLTVVTKNSVQVYHKVPSVQLLNVFMRYSLLSSLWDWWRPHPTSLKWELGWRIARERSDVGLGRALDTIDATVIEVGGSDPDQLVVLYERGVVVSHPLTESESTSAFTLAIAGNTFLTYGAISVVSSTMRVDSTTASIIVMVSFLTVFFLFDLVFLEGVTLDEDYAEHVGEEPYGGFATDRSDVPGCGDTLVLPTVQQLLEAVRASVPAVECYHSAMSGIAVGPDRAQTFADLLDQSIKRQRLSGRRVPGVMPEGVFNRFYFLSAPFFVLSLPFFLLALDE